MSELKDTDKAPRPLNPSKPPVRPYGASKVKDQLNHALDTFIRIFREDMDTRQQQEQENTQLKAKLQEKESLYKAVIDDVFEDMECLDGCDSYGHEEACPIANGSEAFKLLRRKLQEREARIARLETQLIESQETLLLYNPVLMKANGEVLNETQQQSLVEIEIRLLDLIEKVLEKTRDDLLEKSNPSRFSREQDTEWSDLDRMRAGTQISLDAFRVFSEQLRNSVKDGND